MHIHDLMHEAIANRASDIHLKTGNPPIFHINRDGELIFKGGEYWIEASGIHN